MLPGGSHWDGAYPGAGRGALRLSWSHNSISSYYGKTCADELECLEVRGLEMLHGGCLTGLHADAGAWARILAAIDTPGTRATLL